MKADLVRSNISCVVTPLSQSCESVKKQIQRIVDTPAECLATISIELRLIDNVIKSCGVTGFDSLSGEICMMLNHAINEKRFSDDDVTELGMALTFGLGALTNYLKVFVKGAPDTDISILDAINSCRTFRGVPVISTESVIRVNLDSIDGFMAGHCGGESDVERARIYSLGRNNCNQILVDWSTNKDVSIFIELSNVFKSYYLVSQNHTLSTAWWMLSTVSGMIGNRDFIAPSNLISGVWNIALLANRAALLPEETLVPQIDENSIATIAAAILDNTGDASLSEALKTHLKIEYESSNNTASSTITNVVDLSLEQLVPQLVRSYDLAVVCLNKSSRSESSQSEQYFSSFKNVIAEIKNLLAAIQQQGIANEVEQIRITVENVDRWHDLGEANKSQVQERLVISQKMVEELTKNELLDSLFSKTIPHDVKSSLINETLIEISKVKRAINVQNGESIQGDEIEEALSGLESAGSALTFIEAHELANLLLGAAALFREDYDDFKILLAKEKSKSAAFAVVSVELYLKSITSGIAQREEVVGKAILELKSQNQYVDDRVLVIDYSKESTADADPFIDEINDSFDGIAKLAVAIDMDNKDVFARSNEDLIKLGAASAIKGLDNISNLCAALVAATEKAAHTYHFTEDGLDPLEILKSMKAGYDALKVCLSEYLQTKASKFFVVDHVERLNMSIVPVAKADLNPVEAIEAEVPVPTQVVSEEIDLIALAKSQLAGEVGSEDIQANIFKSEFKECFSHVDAFVKNFDGEKEAEYLPSDSLIRAFHTLRSICASNNHVAVGNIAGLLEDELNVIRSEGVSYVGVMDLFVILNNEISLFLEKDFDKREIKHRIAYFRKEFISFKVPVDAQERTEVVADEVLTPDTSTPEAVETPAPATADHTESEFTQAIESEYNIDLLPFFIDEAEEISPLVRENISQWRMDTTNNALIEVIKRQMHTLKGSASLGGVAAVVTVTHHLEDLFEGLHVGLITVDGSSIDLVLRCIDFIDAGINAARKQEPFVAPDSMVDELLNAANGVVEAAVQKVDESANITVIDEIDPQDLPGEMIDPALMSEHVTVPVQKAEAEVKLVAEQDPDPVLETHETLPIDAEGTLYDVICKSESQFKSNESNTTKQGTASKIRVDSTLIDSAIEKVTELSAGKYRIDESVSTIERTLVAVEHSVKSIQTLQRQLELEIRNQSNQPSIELVSGDSGLEKYGQLGAMNVKLGYLMDSLTEDIEQLSEDKRMLSYSVSGQSRSIDAVKSDILQTRLVPFIHHKGKFKTLCEMTGKQVGKGINFSFDNSKALIDREIYDAIGEPITHILRNAIDHGLESEEERSASGKKPKGNISIKTENTAKSIKVIISDDGRGIDPERVFNKAIEEGIVSSNEELTDQEKLQLITRNGFSTASKVSTLSGRGVGMDIVKSAIERFGGNLTIKSKIGVGTSFILDIPINGSANHAMVIKVEQGYYAIPRTYIERFEYLSCEDVDSMLASTNPMLTHDENDFQLVSIEDTLGFKGKQEKNDSGQYAILYINKGDVQLAVVVNDVLSFPEIHTKPLNGPIADLPGLLGYSEMPSGDILLVIDPVELYQRNLIKIDGIVQLRQETSRTMDFTDSYNALVVDDSSAYRSLFKGWLDDDGWVVERMVDAISPF